MRALRDRWALVAPVFVVCAIGCSTATPGTSGAGSKDAGGGGSAGHDTGSAAGAAGASGAAGAAGSQVARDGGSSAVPDGGATAGRDGGNARDGGSTVVPDAGSTAARDAGSSAKCDGANLKWMTARKTNYTSYPDPGSEECVKYNGCMWEGQFAACDGKKTKDWVSSHNIVAAFPDFASLELHDLCLRSGDKTIVVTVYDTCGDSDCDGCCTENQGNADQLIDIESYTNERWGVDDGAIQWADLGPTATAGCN